MLSEKNHKSYALDERTKVFADAPNVVVSLIIINKLDQNGHVYTSMKQGQLLHFSFAVDPNYHPRDMWNTTTRLTPNIDH